MPVTGRLVWAIGDWGRASEHIGNRWESIAAKLVREQLRPVDRLIVHHEDPALMSAVLSTGLPHADALRAYADDGALQLEPLDFKWSLETAAARQVSAETLARLLESDLAPLNAAILQAKRELGLDDDADMVAGNGRFVAPEHPANRMALKHEPDLPAVVIPLDAHAFFRPLPGWPAAVEVAGIEGSDLEREKGIEAIERFYRLGAGVTGALTRLKTGLFEEQPLEINAAEELATLRRTGRAQHLNAVLLDLEHRMGIRRTRDEQLNNLPRQVYPFGKLKGDLQRLRVPRSAMEGKGAMGRAYGEITKELATLMKAIGRELVAGGVSEEETLARLQTKHQDWANLVRQRLPEVAKRMTETPPETAALPNAQSSPQG
jgi:hypothetical protein